MLEDQPTKRRRRRKTNRSGQDHGTSKVLLISLRPSSEKPLRNAGEGWDVAIPRVWGRIRISRLYRGTQVSIYKKKYKKKV